MGLALDESKENDENIDIDGVTFLVDRDLMDSCGGIKIDFMDSGMRSGFVLSSTIPISGGKSSCGSSCGSGSCG